MNCSIEDFSNNIATQMLTFGVGSVALKEKSDNLRSRILEYSQKNLYPKSIRVGTKTHSGYKIARDIVQEINKTWKYNVASVMEQSGGFSVKLDISNGFLDIMTAVDNLAEERSLRESRQPHYSDEITNDPFSTTSETQAELIAELAITRSDNFTSAVITRLQESLPGVEYRVITEYEAFDITKGSRNPYSGQAASFFFNGIVYFVEGKVTSENAVHEFLHPFVRAVEADNPVLFANLYKQALQLDQNMNSGIADVLSELEMDPNTEEYKREFLVRVMQSIVLNKFESDSGAKTFIDRLFYAIKQILKKFFGNVKISKLSPTITMYDLAEMLKNESFDIDIEMVSDADFVEYLETQNVNLSEISRAFEQIESSRDTQGYLLKSLKDLARALDRDIERFQKYPNENSLRLLLASRDGDSFPKIRKLIEDDGIKLSNPEFVRTMTEELSEESKIIRQSDTMATSIVRIATLIEKLTDNTIGKQYLLKEITNGDDRHNLSAIHYFEGMFRTYREMASDIISKLNETNAVDSTNVILQKLNSIINNSNKGLDIVKKQRFNTIKSLFIESSSILNDNIDIIYDPLIKKAEEDLSKNQGSKYLQERVARLKSEKKQLIVTPEKINDILVGESSDVSFIEGWVLSAMQSTDPIIGNLGKIFKDSFNTATAKSTEVYWQFAQKLKPLLDKAGFSGTNYMELYKQIVYLGSSGQIEVFEDANGNKVRSINEEKTVYKLLHSTTDQAIIDRNKLINDIEVAKLEGRTEDAITKQRELYELEKNYFYRPFTEEYYSKTSLYDTEAGKKAQKYLYAADTVIHHLENLILVAEIDGTDIAEITQLKESLEEAKYNKRNLKSNHNSDGSPKTGEMLEIAEALQNVTKRSRDFYEEPVVQQDLFEQEYNNAVLQAKAKYPGSEIKQSKYIQNWISKNTIITYTKEYYEERKLISDAVNQAMLGLPESLKDVYARKNKIRNDLSLIKQVYRNYHTGQIEAGDIPAGLMTEIKNLESQMFDLDIEIQLIKGLPPGFTESDLRFVKTMNKMYTAGYKSGSEEDLSGYALSDNHLEMYEVYKEKKSELAEFNKTITTELEKSLQHMFAQLNSMETTIKTPDYVQSLESLIAHYMPEISSEDPSLYKDPSEVELIDADRTFRALMKKPAFKAWIDANHIKYEQSYTLGSSNKSIYGYVVLSPWLMKDVDVKYKKQVEVGDRIFEYPTRKYLTQKIKEQYVTSRIPGKTVDAQGEWLPRPVTDTQNPPKDSRYSNDAYFNLQRDKPALFEVLENIKEIYISMQMLAPRNARMNFEIPRFGADGYEINLKFTNNVGREGFIEYFRTLKRKFFGIEGDEYEDAGLNPQSLNDTKRKIALISMDFFGDEVSKIPVSGKFNVPAENVSMNIPYSMMRYFFSLQELNEKVAISPVVRSLQSVLAEEENALKNTQALNRSAFLSRGLSLFGNKKGFYARKELVDSFIRRHFEGEQVVGFLSQRPEVLKILRTLSGFTAKVFLSTPESAIKNRVNMSLNNVMNLAGRDMVDKESYYKGKVWATKMMSSLIVNSYDAGMYTYEEMLTDYFDPVQGRSKKNLGTKFHRTPMMDVFGDNSLLLMPRKWMETQGTVTLFAQMMYYKKIPRTLNGKTEMVPYIEAFEIRDKKLVLKEGFDESYALGGKEFNAFKNKMDQRIAFTNGDMSDIGKSHGDKYVIWNMALSMMRFFPMMFLNRFQTNIKRKDDSRSWFNPSNLEFLPRQNHITGDIYMGYFTSSLLSIIRLLKSRGQEFNYMSDTEKQNLRKFLTEIAISVALFIIIRAAFDYDPDDEDRYKKLRANSAPLPFFGTVDEGKFDLGGYAFNKALQMTMLIQNEHNTFTPMPGMGLNNYANMFMIKGITIQPTIETLTKTLTQLYLLTTGDERAFYDKRVGPYSWQQKDSAKILQVLGKHFGLTGSTIDPVTNIQALESFKSR